MSGGTHAFHSIVLSDPMPARKSVVEASWSSLSLASFSRSSLFFIIAIKAVTQ